VYQRQRKNSTREGTDSTFQIPNGIAVVCLKNVSLKTKQLKLVGLTSSRASRGSLDLPVPNWSAQTDRIAREDRR
jgi:hypothetical protein